MMGALGGAPLTMVPGALSRFFTAPPALQVTFLPLMNTSSSWEIVPSAKLDPGKMK